MDAVPCRSLTKDEIARLEAQGCRADDWARVQVAPGFTTGAVWRARLRGDCQLGVFAAPESGISDAELRDCRVGDDARVARARASDCAIGTGATIDDVGEIAGQKTPDGAAAYAATVINESGGREVWLHPGLSAPLAWLEAFVPAAPDHNKNGGAKLRALSRQAAEAALARRGEIGAGAVVRDCGRLRGCAIGPGAQVDGAALLEDCVVEGDVGPGAVARRSVVAAGGVLGEQCIAENCFVGDGAVLGHGFKAEHSLFFANCDCHRGEACAAFCGPFTVSHHQSTLLLAGIYSFFNAGSGTNFSNHRYKLGPRHAGVMERGCKCGSGSYLMWPAHIGAFTTVLGHHPRPLDTVAFPFSRLREENGRSVLLPGANLFSVGLLRDLEKWPARDRRRAPGPEPLHCGFCPGTVVALERALTLLEKFSAAGGDAATIEWNGAVIPAAWLARAIARHRAAIAILVGEIVARVLGDDPEAALRAMTAAPRYIVAINQYDDLAGTYLPVPAVPAFLRCLAIGEFADYAAARAWLAMAADLPKAERAWLTGRLVAAPDSRADLRAAIVKLLDAWAAAEPERAAARKRDAEKEFAPEMRLGFGLLGDANADFAAVNGAARAAALAAIDEAAAQAVAVATRLRQALA